MTLNNSKSHGKRLNMRKQTVTQVILKVLFLCVLLPCSLHGQSPRTVLLLERLEPEWRAERHVEKVAQAKAGNVDFVMIGDSITHYWERQQTCNERFTPYKTLNLADGSIELKLFEKGGHGMDGCDWISDATEWLRACKIVGAAQ